MVRKRSFNIETSYQEIPKFWEEHCKDSGDEVVPGMYGLCAYKYACWFAFAAKKLNDRDDSLFAPIVVNAAFACELFMKSLRNRSYRGHDFKCLFYQLHEKIKEEIKERSMIVFWDSFINEVKNAYETWKICLREGFSPKSVGDFYNSAL